MRLVRLRPLGILGPNGPAQSFVSSQAQSISPDAVSRITVVSETTLCSSAFKFLFRPIPLSDAVTAVPDSLDSARPLIVASASARSSTTSKRAVFARSAINFSRIITPPLPSIHQRKPFEWRGAWSGGVHLFQQSGGSCIGRIEAQSVVDKRLCFPIPIRRDENICSGFRPLGRLYANFCKPRLITRVRRVKVDSLLELTGGKHPVAITHQTFPILKVRFCWLGAGWD